MNEIAKQKEQLPAYIKQEDALIGVERIDEFLTPQRVKVKQKQSNEEKFGDYKNGDMVFMPENTLFMPSGKEFFFTPVMFWVEYLKTNPIGTEPFIAERSLDPDSDLADLCRNPEMWKVPVPDKADKFIRHSEVLNFMVMPWELDDPEFEDMLFVFSFARGQRRDGEKLLQLVKRRQKRGIPMWASVFQAKSASRKNAEGDWYGIDIANPDAESGQSQVVPEETYAKYKELNAVLIKRKADIDLRHEEEEEEDEEDDTKTVDTTDM